MEFIEEELKEVKKNLSNEQKRLFQSYHRYKTSIFDQFDEKIKSGVKATLAQTLSPFNHPDLTDAFCSEGDLNIEKILDGGIFLVDMPIAKWGLGAKVAYTFIKLRFYNLMQKHHNAENREKPVFFMCDEFQEIVSCNKDGLSDLNFWDKARSSKTIGIISAQSIASFFAATPNRDYAYALLQNFRNKICLSSEDPLTIEYISKLTGQAKSQRKSRGQDITISEARDDVLEAQIFRSLPPNSALALLTINNISRDDALKLYPIYLKPQNKPKKSS
jgi:type IV secretory pathway TraG/TraD family ATPase VirD4